MGYNLGKQTSLAQISISYQHLYNILGRKPKIHIQFIDFTKKTILRKSQILTSTLQKQRKECSLSQHKIKPLHLRLTQTQEIENL